MVGSALAERCLRYLLGRVGEAFAADRVTDIAQTHHGVRRILDRPGRRRVRQVKQPSYSLGCHPVMHLVPPRVAEHRDVLDVFRVPVVLVKPKVYHPGAFRVAYERERRATRRLSESSYLIM